MINGISPYSNNYSSRFSGTRFGSSDAKAEDKKAEKPAEEPSTPTELTSIDGLYNTPAGKKLLEESDAYRKELKDYDDLSKYDQYTQNALIAGSATAALCGNYGYSLLMAAYPLAKSIYTTLKKLGEWSY